MKAMERKRAMEASVPERVIAFGIGGGERAVRFRWRQHPSRGPCDV